jgi:hypothetical protein
LKKGIKERTGVVKVVVELQGYPVLINTCSFFSSIGQYPEYNKSEDSTNQESERTVYSQ